MTTRKFWNEPNLSPTEVKRQHYVPQVLLRAFTGVDGKIRVVDLENGGNEYRTSTVNVGLETRFNDVVLEGVRLSTEDWLAKLEGQAAPVMGKLIHDPDSITSLFVDEEFYIARFIVAVSFCIPAFRDRHESIVISMFPQIKDMVRDQVYHQHSKEEAEAIWDEMKSKPDHWWFNESEPQQPAETATFMLSEVQGFANLLRVAPWRIGLAPDSIPLYTSDNPVAGYLNPVRPWWEGAAFASLTYFVPLSPSVLLRVERRLDREDGGRRRSDFSSAKISFARHVVICDATRYLYGEGLVVPRDCATDCLGRIGPANLEFAVRYLGFDPRPPTGRPIVS
ncbi:MAG: DUF4238 domain-containing protein [Dehalococcoidia bacterium]|nr:DUF4238 domain-containing protein [Dehalococcoidia bacterium]